ncbi:dihydroorotase [Patescibacteria group bacterium]|nr:MAG: dihydroorotase [Patescibacteria group bacterium]
MILDRDSVQKPIRIRLRRPDNWHNHFRQKGDPRFAPTVAYIARQFARANAMGNIDPPILTATQMIGYWNDIREVAKAAGFLDFKPLMVVMASPNTTPAMLTAAFSAGAYGVKIMPANATTNSAHGIIDYKDPKFLDVLRVTRDQRRTALFHAELPSRPRAVRERAFIPILDQIRKKIPDLKICVEHISDAQMVEWVINQGDLVCATVTPHHMSVTSDMADQDPHLQCMPYPKSLQDVFAVRTAAMSHPRFFYGSDNASHLRPAKERTDASPASGVFTAPTELPVLVELFEAHGHLDQLEEFLCERGAHWHGVPLNQGEIELVRNPWDVPDVIDLCNGHEIVPYNTIPH